VASVAVGGVKEKQISTDLKFSLVCESINCKSKKGF
jgi:hypothetical protein